MTTQTAGVLATIKVRNKPVDVRVLEFTARGAKVKTLDGYQFDPYDRSFPPELLSDVAWVSLDDLRNVREDRVK